MSHVDLDGAGRRALLEELLTGAHVGIAAAGRDGVFTTVPRSWPTAGALRLKGRWLLDFVDPPSQNAIISAWIKLDGELVGSMEVRLRGGQSARAYLIDLLDSDGVYAVVLVTDSDLAAALPPTQSQAPPPQVARVRRNEAGEVISFDDRAAGLLGWSQAAMANRRSLGVHRDDHEVAHANWGSLLADPEGIFRFRARLRRQDGGFRWFDITERNRVDPDGTSYVEGEIVNVDSEVAAQEAVRAREAQLHLLMETVPVGIGHLGPDGEVLYANDLIRRMMSADPTADVTALSALRPADRDRLREAIAATMEDGLSRDLVVSHDGEEAAARILDVVLRPLDPGDVAAGVIACASDVTESRRLRRALEHRANVDHLTGVASRSHTITTLEDHLAAESRGWLGVLFVDLDRFKSVNDRLGHAAGDAVLRTVAQRLAGAVRTDDTVGRLGGDEFLLICPDLSGEVEVQAIARRVRASIEEPMVVGDELIAITASIGLAYVEDDDVDADEIVARADATMYLAKGAGRAPLSAT